MGNLNPLFTLIGRHGPPYSDENTVIYHDGAMAGGLSLALIRTMILRMMATSATIFGLPAFVSLSKNSRMEGS